MKKSWKATPLFEKLYETYKTDSLNVTVLEEKLEKEGMVEDVREAFLTYIRWNMNPSLHISNIVYEEAKETLAEHGYLEAI